MDQKLARSVSRGCSKSTSVGLGGKLTLEWGVRKDKGRVPQAQADIHKDRVRGLWWLNQKAEAGYQPWLSTGDK